MQNFDINSMLVRTFDGDSLSKIAIHNFEKSWKIEISVDLEFSTVYLDDVNGISDIYSSTFGVIGVAVAALPPLAKFLTLKWPIEFQIDTDRFLKVCNSPEPLWRKVVDIEID